MLPLPDNFRYLNRENRWMDFHWSGLGLARDGALQLLSSPKLLDTPPDPSGLAIPDAPSGVAVDASGRIFFSAPENNEVLSIGGCFADLVRLHCLLRSSGLGALSSPRGLLVLKHPERLVVVDSGNHRLLFFDLASLELTDVWGPADVAANPSPGSAPGQFDTPWTASADEDGNLYVLDYGNQRVQKFRPTGEPDIAFGERMQQNNLLPHPTALAVAAAGADVNVFVFDADAHSIYVFDGTGMPLRQPDGDVLAISYPGMTAVLALAVGPNALYAGDNNLLSVLSFSRSRGFPFAGDAVGFGGPVAALTVDPAGALVVCQGGESQPLYMLAAGAYQPFGVLWSNAIAGGKTPVKWNRLRTYMEKAAGAHIEFYYSVSDSPTTPPVDVSSTNPFADPHWQQLPNDVADFLLSGDKNIFVYLGAVFRGDRSATVRLTQMRVDFDDPGYLPYLPAIYRKSETEADFTRRFLALFQGVFEDIEDEIDSLPRFFDPNAAPEEGLPWLASWLAVDLDQGQPASRIRSAIARAYHRYQWRGTAEGLRLALLQDAGVHANIDQPIDNASFWSFAADTKCSGVPSTPTGVQLGATTGLPNMQPGGAVLGSTAELDHSYLITDAEFGEPLFDGSAYQFVVEVYRSEIDSEARMALVQSIIEREKPAHTIGKIMILDASMRVGFQARVGIESIVAGTPGPSGLGVPGQHGGLRLAGQTSPRVGTSRVGENLKIES